MLPLGPKCPHEAAESHSRVMSSRNKLMTYAASLLSTDQAQVCVFTSHLF